MNKIITFMLLGLFLINLTTALDTLKPAKLNQEYTILQTCASCTYINISISNINGLVEPNVVMINNGSGVWEYYYTPTTTGRYDVTGVGEASIFNQRYNCYYPSLNYIV